MKKFLTVLALFLVSCMTYAQEIQGWGSAWVVDGDTYWITVEDRSVFKRLQKQTFGKGTANYVYSNGHYKFKTRVLNINTEESVHRNKSKNTEFGKQTSDLVKTELNKKRVGFACDGTDKYGRALCMVFLDKEDYGLSLVKRGYSPYVTYFGKNKWDHQGYVSAQLHAKRHKLGVW